MEKLFNSMFESVQTDLSKNLAAAKANKMTLEPAPANLKGSGSIPINFHLNAQGEYYYSLDKYGAGVTIHITAVIQNPDATYDITVKSSDGGGGHWSNVKAGQELKCDLKTSFWHNTKIEVWIKANVVNVDGKGQMNYTY